MPEDKKTVDIDTSGPDATIDIEEKKDEAVIEQSEVTEQETDKTYENEKPLTAKKSNNRVAHRHNYRGPQANLLAQYME